MKKKIIFIIICLVAILLLMYFCNNQIKKYDINEKVVNYNLFNYNEKKEYIRYLFKFINPIEITRFVKIENIDLSRYGDLSVGQDILWEIKYEGYKGLFEYLFDKNTYDFNALPVTKNFKDKFNTSLYSYFNLVSSIDSQIIVRLYYNERKIEVICAYNFVMDEPQNEISYFYNYNLDSNGYVDDIIFVRSD